MGTPGPDTEKGRVVDERTLESYGETRLDRILITPPVSNIISDEGVESLLRLLLSITDTNGGPVLHLLRCTQEGLGRVSTYTCNGRGSRE